MTTDGASRVATQWASTPAVVLVGGLGTRLRCVVNDRPKVLAMVAGRPFLFHLLDQLAEGGVHEVVLCSGYRAGQVEAEVGSAYREMTIHYSPEDSPMGTGGALRLALRHVDADNMLVMNGDSFCEVDLQGFGHFHQRHPEAASMVLTHVPDVARFGAVEVNAEGRVLSFLEKGERTGPGLINAGIYLLPRKMIEVLPEGQMVSLERELFPAWLPDRLRGFAAGGTFIDIGTPESYARADTFFGVS